MAAFANKDTNLQNSIVEIDQYSSVFVCYMLAGVGTFLSWLAFEYCYPLEIGMVLDTSFCLTSNHTIDISSMHNASK